jgi:hypothetical protein
MTLKELAKRLRNAADMLDDLVGINIDRPTKNESKQTAEKILKKTKRVAWQHKPENKAKYEAWKKLMSKRNSK